MQTSRAVRCRAAATFGYAVIAAGLLSLMSAANAADATKGEKVFAKCKVCHEASAEKNKIGPYLKGVFGRKAGTAKGFSYSPAMKASGIVWGEEKIKAFIGNPKTLVPNNKMTFAGLKKEEEVANLIAYLKEATK
jgi:cytochrome c